MIQQPIYVLKETVLVFMIPQPIYVLKETELVFMIQQPIYVLKETVDGISRQQSGAGSGAGTAVYLQDTFIFLV